MADTIYTFRTNYFRVKNPEHFMKFMKIAGFTEETLWMRNDMFAFGSDCGDLSHVLNPLFPAILNNFDIMLDPSEETAFTATENDRLDSWIENHIGENYDYDDFAEYDDIEAIFCNYVMNNCIAPDDAVIIITISHEKLRSVYGDACVITSDSIRYTSLECVAIEMAREKLNNPDYTTDLYY